VKGKSAEKRSALPRLRVRGQQGYIV
jgi:hypothetical protein